VLYYVLKLCTVIITLGWAVLTVLLIGFCHAHRAHFTVRKFCVYLCVCWVFLFHTAYFCRIIVSAVGWTWLDWSLLLRTYPPSVLWHCWLGHLTRKKPLPDMTYNVFGGTLNLTLSIYLSIWDSYVMAVQTESWVESQMKLLDLYKHVFRISSKGRRNKVPLETACWVPWEYRGTSNDVDISHRSCEALFGNWVLV